MYENLYTHDRSALRVNQGTIVVLLFVAFVGSWPLLVAAVATVMGVGAALSRPGFGVLYSRILRPAGWVQPDRVAGDPAPTRFAQALGAGMLAISSLMLWLDHALLGWTLAWFVVALASLDLASGICAGCALHRGLARMGVPGFVRAGAPRGRADR